MLSNFIYENFFENETDYLENNEYFRLPIKKDSSRDYIYYILKGTKLEPDLITILEREKK